MIMVILNLLAMGAAFAADNFPGTTISGASGSTLTSGGAAPLGTLDIGETWICTATCAVTQNDVDYLQ